MPVPFWSANTIKEAFPGVLGNKGIYLIKNKGTRVLNEQKGNQGTFGEMRA